MDYKFDRQILDIIDNHWIVLLRPLGILILSGAVSAILYAGRYGLLGTLGTGADMVYLISICIILLGLHLFFMYLFRYFISNWIITTERIIDVQYLPFLEDDATFVDIERIHKIEKKKTGILQNLLNYGEVYVDVTGIPQTLCFRNVPNPGKFVEIVNKVKHQKAEAKENQAAK